MPSQANKTGGSSRGGGITTSREQNKINVIYPHWLWLVYIISIVPDNVDIDEIWCCTLVCTLCKDWLVEYVSRFRLICIVILETKDTGTKVYIWVLKISFQIQVPDITPHWEQSCLNIFGNKSLSMRIFFLIQPQEHEDGFCCFITRLTVGVPGHPRGQWGWDQDFALQASEVLPHHTEKTFFCVC